MERKYNINKENASEYGKKGKRGQAPEKKLLSDAIKGQITYEECAELLIKEARGGNIKAIEILMDRTAGKAVTEIDITGGLDITEIKLKD